MHKTAGWQWISLAGFLAGVAAAFMSGSRGALLALPVILLLLAPIVWRRSRRTFLAICGFLVCSPPYCLPAMSEA